MTGDPLKIITIVVDTDADEMRIESDHETDAETFYWLHRAATMTLEGDEEDDE